MTTHACPHCQSLIGLVGVEMPKQAPGSIDCPVCDNTLIEWNGSISYWNPLIIRNGPPLEIEPDLDDVP